MRSQAHRRAFLVLQAFLRSAAPEGFQTVVVAGLVGEDVDDHVEEVQADPGRPLVDLLLPPRRGLVAVHASLLQLKCPSSLSFASFVRAPYNPLSWMISYTPSGTRYRTLSPLASIRRIPVAEMSTRVHSTGMILSKLSSASSRCSRLEMS